MSVIRGFVASRMDESSLALFNNLNTTLNWIVDIILFIPMFTVTVRRLHDRDDNGWLAILLEVIPLVLIGTASILLGNYDKSYMANAYVSPNGVAGLMKNYFMPFMLVLLLAKAVLIIKILLFTKPGTEGPNSYGPDPVRIIPEPTEEKQE